MSAGVVGEGVLQLAERVWRVGKVTFRADFDSGNLGGVYVACCPDGSTAHMLTISPDSAGAGAVGTGGGVEYRVWYFFGVSGLSRGERLRLVITGLNPVAKVYNADMRPCVCRCVLGRCRPALPPPLASPPHACVVCVL